MTHLYVGHDSFICGTWLVDLWDMTISQVGHDSLICGTWLVHVWDMIPSYVGHDSFTRGTWLVHMCDSFMCGTWLINECNMTHLCMWHDSFAPLTEEIRLKIFGSPYWTVFPSTLLSDGDFRLLPWKPVWNYVDSRENLFESYGDSRENLFEILAVVNIWSLISSARGAGCHGTHLCVWCMSESCPKYEGVMSHQPTL